MKEHWLILGASSAIARAFAREIAMKGAAITLAGRDPEDLMASAKDTEYRGAAFTRVMICDATNAKSRAACIADAVIPDTTLNLLIAIGEMPSQEDMNRDPALLSRMIEANYSGPLALLQGLAPEFEKQLGGHIVVIGSVAGDRGRRKNFLYGSTKSGLATYAEGLRSRLFASKASVTLVKPGIIDTAMT